MNPLVTSTELVVPHADEANPRLPTFVGVVGLGHVLSVAAECGASVRLRASIRELTVGFVDVVAGQVCSATIPGANGHHALSLLAGFRALDVRPEPRRWISR